MSDDEGILWISAPRGGASADTGWQWRDGELVYTTRPRWVQTRAIDRGGALRSEVVAEFRRTSGIGRQHRPRWRDLTAEIAGEFEQLTTRSDELTAVIDRRCSKIARQVTGRARAGRSPQKVRTVPCWVCRTPIATRASHRSYCSRKCKRTHYRRRGGAETERAYMKQWRAAKAADAVWAAAARAQSCKSKAARERRERLRSLAERSPRQCPECETTFVPLMAKRVYCAEVCRVRAAKRRYWQAHQSALNAKRNARRQVAREQRRAA